MDRQNFEHLLGAGAFATFDTFAPEDRGWEMPAAFDEVQLPEFPVDALPGPAEAMVEAVAEALQVPPEMPGALVLGALAAAVQDKFTVAPRPDWRETLSLYIAVAAPPAFRKSAVLAALTAPHCRYEKERRQAERLAVAEGMAKISALEKAKQATENRFARGDADMGQVLDIARELEEALEAAIHPYRLIADDTTTEKLADLMAQQKGSIAVVSSEGGIFDLLAGKRYDGTGSLDLYLKAHCGDRVVVDRVGRPGCEIESPRLTMLLTVQPEVLRGVMSNPSFRGRGLCGRILYIQCRNNLGRRKSDPPPLPEGVRTEYAELIYRLLSSQCKGEIHLDSDANSIRTSYQDFIESKLGGQWDFMGDWGGKAVGMVIRLAAILHIAQCIGDPTEQPISGETMAAATRLGELFSGHAEAVYTTAGADESTADAKYLWRRIKADGRPEISKRDLYNQCKGKFRKVEQMEPALQTLVNMGYVKITTASTGGRPTQKIVVNPLEQNPQK